MAVQKYVSDVKTINWDNQIVYEKLSDLSFLNLMFGQENMERVKQQMGDKAPKINIENFIANRDNCSFEIKPIGNIAFFVADREEPKTIKLISETTSKFKFILWIQILPLGNSQCKMRMTLHTELNMMMKMMLGKKLGAGLNQIADGITQMPFGMI